ncbi:MAG: TolC family protein, partial [Muribaculaceae bacterium]|nr:TolC family protein [Muribaculaceae bacterium]
MRLIIISLLAILSVSTYAGSRSAESVAQKIVSSSPKLKTLKAVSDAENAKNMTEANLPDPEIEGEYLVAPAGEQDRWGAGISWGLDWPGVYSARKGVAKALSELNLRKIKNEEYGLAVATRRILLDYILQTSQIETLRDILLTTDSICLLATKSRNGGEMTQLDLNKIQLETASLNARLTSLLDSRMQSVAELSQIAGYDCTP